MEKTKVLFVLIFILSSKINYASQNIHFEYSNHLPEDMPIAPPGPIPSQKPPAPTPEDFDAKVAALRDYSKSLTNANEDNNEWAKVYSYNAGPSGAYYEGDTNSFFSLEDTLKTLFVLLVVLTLGFVIYKDYKKLKE